jgi:acyl-CoA reductase-like NAD-dependent aldehyde dehydrogenase
METAVIPSRDPGKRMLTFRKPNGVYAAITPWNFPTLIPVELIAPGIAAGNAIVIKPSEWTPAAMANFMQIMADAGLPDGVVNVVYGAGDVGELLVTHPGIDAIGFVGSHVTAEKILRAAGFTSSPATRQPGRQTARASSRSGTSSTRRARWSSTHWRYRLRSRAPRRVRGARR